MLRISRRLSVQQSVGVHLPQLIDLNVSHSRVHLLSTTTILLLLLLASKHVVVGAAVGSPHLPFEIPLI